MKRLFVLLAAAVSTFVLLGILFVWASEPTYEGKPVTYWISKLGNAAPSGGLLGEDALDKMDSAKTVPYLLQTITAPKSYRKKWPAFYIKYYPKIPAIFQRCLPDPTWTPPSDFTRNRAADYLFKLGRKNDPNAKAVIPKLVSLLNDEDFWTRFLSADALSGFHTNAAPAFDIIINQLKNDPNKLTYPAFELLGQDIGSGAHEAVAALAADISSTNDFVRMGCARILWKLDPSRSNTIRPVVLELSTNEAQGIRIEAASLLWRMDKNAKAVALICGRLLNDDTNPYDYRTVLLLNQIGPDGRAAAPALSDWLQRNRATKPSFIVTKADEALSKMNK